MAEVILNLRKLAEEALDAEMKRRDIVAVIRCKECKHRPKEPYPGASGFNLQFPDIVCPYYCDDGYYCEYPPDDFFCANGEREDKTDDAK